MPSVPSRSAATASTSAASVPAAASAASAADRSKPGLPPLKIDITLLRKNAEQLSYVAGEGQSHVATGPGGERRLRKVEALELIVYADGALRRALQRALLSVPMPLGRWFLQLAPLRHRLRAAASRTP